MLKFCKKLYQIKCFRIISIFGYLPILLSIYAAVPFEKPVQFATAANFFYLFCLAYIVLPLVLIGLIEGFYKFKKNSLKIDDIKNIPFSIFCTGLFLVLFQ